MGRILDSIKWHIFRIPIKEQRFLTVTPAEKIKELEKDIYSKKILQRNAQLEVELKKLQKKVKELEEKKQEEKEEQEIFKDILRKRKKEKKEEKKLSLLLKIDAPFPSLALKSNRIFGKFVGFYVKDTDDGTTIYYPAIKRGKKLMKINCPTINPLNFFKSELNLVSQIKSGRLDTDIEPDSEGKMVLMKEKEALEKIYGQKVKIINMGEAERLDYEKRLATQKEQIRQYVNRIKELEEKEVEYENQLNEMELENLQLKRDRDIQAASKTSLIEKQIGMVTATAKALSSVQDLQINEILAEKQAFALQQANDELIKLINKYVPREKRALAEEEVTRLIQAGIDIRKGAEKPTEVVLRQPPTKKEIEKAIEEKGGTK